PGTAPGRCRSRRRSCRWPPPWRGSPPPRRSISPRRRTSRCTAASATPGRPTATFSTSGRGCSPPASAASAPGATGCWPPPRALPDPEIAMDFNDTPEEAAFRAEVRRWLAENAAEYREPLPEDLSLEEYARLGRLWQKKKAAAGYGSIMWSKADGGLDGTPMQEVIFHQEESKYHVPVGSFVGIGVHLVVPTIRVHGTPEQVERFARPTLLGDLCWCQLFSEPAAGSDLAGLRTRAVRDGDEWVVNGQKVWTSWAQTADWGILLARTDPDVPKHKGLTCFLVDMKTPGIEEIGRAACRERGEEW